MEATESATLEMPMQATKEHLAAIGEVWAVFAKAKLDTVEDKIPPAMKPYLPYFKDKPGDMPGPDAPAGAGA